MNFTPKEREIIKRVAAGRRNAEIADELGNAPTTIRDHVSAIFGKAHVRSRVELAAMAIREGWA